MELDYLQDNQLFSFHWHTELRPLVLLVFISSAAELVVNSTHFCFGNVMAAFHEDI